MRLSWRWRNPNVTLSAFGKEVTRMTSNFKQVFFFWLPDIIRIYAKAYVRPSLTRSIVALYVAALRERSQACVLSTYKSTNGISSDYEIQKPKRDTEKKTCIVQGNAVFRVWRIACAERNSSVYRSCCPPCSAGSVCILCCRSHRSMCVRSLPCEWLWRCTKKRNIRGKTENLKE